MRLSALFLLPLQTLSDDVKSPADFPSWSQPPQVSTMVLVGTASIASEYKFYFNERCGLFKAFLSYPHQLDRFVKVAEPPLVHPALRCLALRKKRADLGRFPRLSQFAPDYQGSGQIGPTRAQSGEVPYTKDVGLYLGCK